MSDNDLKFDTIYYKFEKSIFKVQIEQNLQNSDFWIITYDGNYKWQVEYYTLKKIESKQLKMIFKI
jgi:hypothetical protein